MKNFAFTVIFFASMLLTACEFQNKTSVLNPIAPSNENAAPGGSSPSTPSTPAPSTPSAGTVFGGTFTSSTMNGVPGIGNCTDLQWQISDATLPDIAGTVKATCGGGVTITADLTGKMNGSDVIDLTAKGQAVALGITCGFTLTGVGTRQSTNSVELDYTGNTCLGPVSGTEILRRSSPTPPPPEPTSPPPATPPTADDGTFGCTRMLPDKLNFVKCIHAVIRPTDQYSAFEVTKRVAWGLREQGAGLLLKPTGENIVPWRGYMFAAARIIYADGHLFKVLSDVGRGGTNGPSWQDEGFLDVNRRVGAIDPSLP